MNIFGDAARKRGKDDAKDDLDVQTYEERKLRFDRELKGLKDKINIQFSMQSDYSALNSDQGLDD